MSTQNHKWIIALTAAAFIVVCSIGNESMARPRFSKVFAETYAQEYAETKGNIETCDMCHNRSAVNKYPSNNYAEAMAESAKKVKNGVDNDEMIRMVLKETENKPSAIKGKTFGDLIREGRHPASK